MPPSFCSNDDAAQHYRKEKNHHWVIQILGNAFLHPPPVSAPV